MRAKPVYRINFLGNSSKREILREIKKAPDSQLAHEITYTAKQALLIIAARTHISGILDSLVSRGTTLEDGQKELKQAEDVIYRIAQGEIPNPGMDITELLYFQTLKTIADLGAEQLRRLKHASNQKRPGRPRVRSTKA
jgi:hypothetical protein